ncbi:hypothetical protein [Jannaschia sp. R86511]|uniref:hypothetical protein n=1 Tax=Jannaschia sp. R86511 TaxID=3093853 RepID=UPI0036D3EDC9
MVELKRAPMLLVCLGMVLLSGCSPETGSVTGITRNEAGDLEAVVLTCRGTADMVGVETDGDPDARTDHVWETERTRGTLRLPLTREGLQENELLGTGGFTAEVVGYDTSHRWNSITVPLTQDILDGLQRGSITYGNPDWGLELRQVDEDEFANAGCAALQETLYDS